MNKFEGIKAGDKVLKVSRYPHELSKEAVVQEVTKAGNIKVDGKIYTPDGHERTSHRYPVHHIAPFSQEQIDREIAQQNAEVLSNDIMNRLAKLKSDYAGTYTKLSTEHAKILDIALKEIGY